MTLPASGAEKARAHTIRCWENLGPDPPAVRAPWFYPYRAAPPPQVIAARREADNVLFPPSILIFQFPVPYLPALHRFSAASAPERSSTPAYNSPPRAPYKRRSVKGQPRAPYQP